MFSPNATRKLLGGVLFVGALVPPAIAMTIMPGPKHTYGQVVQKADGSLCVFEGGACATFPEKIMQEQLRPYLGQFVDVEYVLERDSPGTFSYSGVHLDRIKSVTVMAASMDQLPLKVEVKPSKSVYAFFEPIEVHITLTNQTNQSQSLNLDVANTLLCRDYEQPYQTRETVKLEPDSHFHEENPYGLASNKVSLAPGQKLSFDVHSQRMVKPGTYQLLYAVWTQREAGAGSEIPAVSVIPPKSPEEEHQALRNWLAACAPEQKVRVAAKLLKFGDSSGTEEMIRFLASGEASIQQVDPRPIYRYIWAHGGSKGESLMLNLIKRQADPVRFEWMVEDIARTPTYLSLLDDLLGCTHPTSQLPASWAGTPRICDLTAAWLTEHTSGMMHFPKMGSEAQHDDAVASVRSTLKTNSGLWGRAVIGLQQSEFFRKHFTPTHPVFHLGSPSYAEDDEF